MRLYTKYILAHMLLWIFTNTFIGIQANMNENRKYASNARGRSIQEEYKKNSKKKPASGIQSCEPYRETNCRRRLIKFILSLMSNIKENNTLYSFIGNVSKSI